MTPEQEKLLVTTARVLRQHLRSMMRMAGISPSDKAILRGDFMVMDQALKPFGEKPAVQEVSLVDQPFDTRPPNVRVIP